MKVGDVCEFSASSGSYVLHGDLIRVVGFSTSSLSGNNFVDVWPARWDSDGVPSMFEDRRHGHTGKPYMRLYPKDLVVVGSSVCMFNEGGDAS